MSRIEPTHMASIIGEHLHTCRTGVSFRGRNVLVPNGDDVMLTDEQPIEHVGNIGNITYVIIDGVEYRITVEAVEPSVTCDECGERMAQFGPGPGHSFPCSLYVGQTIN